MKRRLMLLTAGLLLVAGCTVTETDRTETGGEAPRGDVSAESVQRETREALTTTGAYLDQERKRIQAEMSEELEQLNAEIADLKTGIEQSGGPERTALERDLQAREQEKTRLEAMKEQAVRTTGAAWDALKEGWQKTKTEFDRRTDTGNRGDSRADGG